MGDPDKRGALLNMSAHRRGAHVTLFLFVCAHTLLSIDRGIIAILAEPIKHVFNLTDTQLGLLSGFGFAIFFGVAGIPLGLLVDRVNRRNILAASVLVFGAMTAVSGAASSFMQLLVCRSIVGAGEAGGTPSMSSILSDLYPPGRRAQAMAVFYAGNPLGAIIAFLVGGTIAAAWGWRATLVTAGVPGALLAAMLLVFVREPARRMDENGRGEHSAPGLVDTLRFVRRRPALIHLLTTPILTSAATAGVFGFVAPFFIRQYGLSLPQVGLLLAVFYGAFGALGTILCGGLVDRLGARDDRWRPLFCAVANIAAALAVLTLISAPNLPLAIAGLAIFAIATTSTYGPLLAMLHALVLPRMRGTVTAIFYLLSYLIGAGSGPLIVGRVSDIVADRGVANPLGWGLTLMAALYAWGALHFCLAARRFPRSKAREAA
jgi:predicted MFS family arabinose efflux permease